MRAGADPWAAGVARRKRGRGWPRGFSGRPPSCCDRPKRPFRNLSARHLSLERMRAMPRAPTPPCARPGTASAACAFLLSTTRKRTPVAAGSFHTSLRSRRVGGVQDRAASVRSGLGNSCNSALLCYGGMFWVVGEDGKSGRPRSTPSTASPLRHAGPRCSQLRLASGCRRHAPSGFSDRNAVAQQAVSLRLTISPSLSATSPPRSPWSPWEVSC